MRTRRAHCRYGTLSLLGCLLAIAVPIEASAQTCDISSAPPGPVKPGAWAELSSGCTGAPTSIEWGSSLANCSPTAGPVTVCNFPVEGTAHVVVGATYAGSLGPAFDTYDMSVSSLAPPTCLVSAMPAGPVQPGAWSDMVAECSGNPSWIQWSSSFANCSPVAGSSTACHFPVAGTSVIEALAAYSDGFGGSFYASDSYLMQVSAAAPPSCYITASPGGPVQPGAWAEFASNCTGSPQAISWGSSLASCAPLSGPETVCSFPVETNATVAVTATYQNGFGGCFSVFDTYAMPVQSSAPPSCVITASPSGPVQPGAWADFTAHCSGNPAFIEWSGSFSGFAACEPIIGSSTSCNFPSAGTGVIVARAGYYAGHFFQGFATDTYAMTVSPLAPPNCNIGMTPQGPLQPGAWADVFARCSGSPASIQWASSLAVCGPLTGAQTVCNFPGPGVAGLDVTATYSSTFGSEYAVKDHLPVLVSGGAPPTCYITATPPSPVRAGDSSRLAANCTGAPLAVSWSSSFASCGTSTGPAIDCVFPTVGSAPFFAQAAYVGCMTASDTFLMHVNVPLSACTYYVVPSDLSNIAIAGGRFAVTVGTPEGCPVGATPFQPWIRVASIVPGSSMAMVTLEVDPNNGPPRATSIVLAGRLFLITQLGQ